MTEPIKQYFVELNRQFSTGMAKENSYRPALKNLLETLLPKMVVTNEPAHFECGAPDYIILREKDHLPVFFVETKDIDDRDLDGRSKTGHKEQFDRYKQALDHILFTDYLDFHLYEQGELTDRVRIGEVRGNKIEALPEAKQKFLDMLEHLSTTACQPITSAKVLAKQMAGKARLLENIIEQAMADNTDSYANDNLRGQYNAFKDVLIHELKPAEFADIYAQTIAYGMFAARLHDDTPEDFGREEAARLIPKTNPFLRQIFNNLAGNDLDERIAWVVDDLVSVFQVTDIPKIMKGYSQNKRHHDPMIHFYEEFLSQYNPGLRKAKGVWYTPQPVVGFIVRAVDEILQRDFGLEEGLADYSTIERMVAVEQSSDKRTSDGMKHTKQRFHRVQILDPATGTGTFLAEVVNQIYDRYRDNQGMWQQYVEQHLLPRLNGFEILMASYAVAHLKLDMLLSETGYQHKTDRRLHVYLTNSLEESNNEQRTLFAQWLSREASEANLIKRDCPVMVMIGNPPYSGESQNKGKWIMSLMESYKKEPGGKQPLNERNPKWLNDDYVKFIRLAQSYIEKNGEGVIGFINPHGYLDNPTFRGMRWNLLKTFDKIYTIDLHGNSKKKETCPDGSKDENVFDIMQGVSINIFVKTGKKGTGELGKVYHKDLYGLRREKYEILDNASLESIEYQEISPSTPMYFFVPKDMELEEQYKQFFGVDELFNLCLLGPNSHRDDFAVTFNEEEAAQHIQDFLNQSLSDDFIRQKYGLKDNRDWNLPMARKKMSGAEKPIKCIYRPFDYRYMLYGDYAFDYSRPLLNDNLIKDNIALIATKQNRESCSVFITSLPLGQHKIAAPYDGSYAMPLYLYKDTLEGEKRIPNLNPDIVKQIGKSLGKQVEPQELFDYIYAVLHSPSYRERYKEFLKIDFPRIPYPTDAEAYHRLAEKGATLRRLHLMEGLPANTGVTFPQEGSEKVECLRWEDDRVYINDVQYFQGVSEEAWNFFIGGYQPAQKWLKDRKGSTLSFEDVKHYQRIIYVLTQTAQIMNTIDV